jgi:AAA family ATPase
MDGFEALSGVLVLGATNIPEAVDPALLRPGRFTKRIYVGPPDEQERVAIFKMYAARMPLAQELDYEELAALTERYSGAEIRQICNRAWEIVVERQGAMGEEDEQDRESTVSMGDIKTAIAETPRDITMERLRRFEDFARKGSII